MKIRTSRDHRGTVRYYIEGIETLGQFRELMGRVLPACDAQLLDWGDGPDATLCQTLVSGERVVFVFDDTMGSFFSGEDSTAEAVLNGVKRVLEAMQLRSSTDPEGLQRQ